MDDTIRSKHNQLTRDTIWSAYLDLLEQMPAETIKVTDICRGAGISRGTFYRYYLDVADLTADVDGWYAALLTPYVERLFSTPERDRSVSLDILTQLMAQLAAHPKYCRVLLCTDRGAAARAQARDLIQTRYWQWLHTYRPQVDPEPEIYSITAARRGGLAVLQRWIEGGFRETPQELLAYFPRLKQTGQDNR